MAEEVTIKGALLNEMIRILKGNYSIDFTRFDVSQFPEDLKSRLLTNNFLEGSWYPALWGSLILDASLKISSAEKPVVPKTIGNMCITNLMNSIHKVLIRLISLEKFTAHGDRILRQYYRGGRVSIEQSTNSVRMDFTDFVGISSSLWLAIAGGFEGACLVIGAKQIDIHVKQKDRLSSSCTIQITWIT